MKTPFFRLKGILDQILRQFPHATRSVKVLSQWEKVVGPSIAKHSQCYAYKGDRLHVMVDDPLWLNELTLARPKIIERFSETFGPDAVRDIQFKFGKIHRPDQNTAPTPPLREAPPVDFPKDLSPELTPEFVETLRSAKQAWAQRQMNPLPKEDIPPPPPSPQRANEWVDVHFPPTGIRSEFLRLEDDLQDFYPR